MAAPKGNRNALKHGLYARRIHRDEATRIGNLPVTDVEGEIAYLRAVISRIALILEKNGLSYRSTRQLSENNANIGLAIEKNVVIFGLVLPYNFGSEARYENR